MKGSAWLAEFLTQNFKYMKAQINLFLQENNSFRGIYDGTPQDFSAMLHKAYKDTEGMRLGIQSMMTAIFEDLGDYETAKKCFDMVLHTAQEDAIPL